MYIYKITNLLNKKIYIGKHKSKRKTYWGSGKLIKQAIKKHGIDNFNKEIIEYCDDEKILNEREIFWIKYYDARNRLIGYNIAEGGDGNSSMIRGFWLNKNLSDEHKKNISLYHANVNGEKNPMYGKTHDLKARELIKNGHVGRKASLDTKSKMSEKRVGEKNTKAKLTEKDVYEIKKDINDGMLVKNIAKKYNVKKPCIWKIIHGYTWKHLK